MEWPLDKSVYLSEIGAPYLDGQAAIRWEEGHKFIRHLALHSPQS